MANEDLKAILDERGVEYNKRSNRKQLEKLVSESAADDDAPLLTDEASSDDAPAEAPEVGEAPAEEPGPAPSKEYGTGSRQIVRIQPNGAWTCPFCDHSNGALLTDCGKCGGVRSGEKVKR